MLSEINFDNWILSDLSISTKGAKAVYILANGSPPKLKLASAAEPLRSPWGASQYDPNQTRSSIDFNVPTYLYILFTRLDNWAKEILLKQSPRFFKKQMSEGEINLMYQPCLKQHIKGETQYPDTVKCKFNYTGSRQLRV